jgi:hypothetical protein
MHRRQRQPVAVRPGQRHAQHPAGPADEEADQLGGGQLGGDHEIALVLPVGVVDHDHRSAGGDVGDSPVDAAELPGHSSTLPVG